MIGGRHRLVTSLKRNSKQETVLRSFHKSNKCGNKKYFLKKNISQFRAVFEMAEGNQDIVRM